MRARRLRLRLIFTALAIAVATEASGQEVPADPSSLARYIPKDSVILYIEYRGLDSQAEAWKKTSAYKILNETPAGSMIEDVATQLIEKLLAKGRANPRQWAEQAIAVAKHMARSGFVWAMISPTKKPSDTAGVLVIRDAYKDKAIRAIMAGYFRSLNAPNTQPQSVTRAGHKVVSGMGKEGEGFTWWVDDSKKEDLVRVLGKPEDADVILETVDGKRPSMTEHARRAEMLKPEGTFLTTGLLLVNLPKNEGGKNFADDYGYLGLNNLTSLDFRWGFQDEALMSITRLATSGPRTGLLALLDLSSFDKGKLPPIPQDSGKFGVAAVDLPGTLDRFVSFAGKFPPGTGISQFASQLKEASPPRLKEDVLAHLGPKIAWYFLPAKKGAAPSPAGMVGAYMEIPRFALICEVDDDSAVSKALDQAMVAANRKLRVMGLPPGEVPAKAARGKAAGGPAVEFRSLPGEGKGYVLNVPQEMTTRFPSTARPTIRVSPKLLVIATSAEVARQVLELKGTWAPSADLEPAYRALPSNLKMVGVSDPRDVLPEQLATLPGKIQQLAAVAAMASGAKAGAGAPPPLVLNIDPSKLPQADAIRSKLFPSLLTVESTAEEFKIVTRDAFPNPGDLRTRAIQLAFLLPAVQAARDAARRAQNPGAAAPNPNPNPNPNPTGTPKPGATIDDPARSKAGAPKAGPRITNPN